MTNEKKRKVPEAGEEIRSKKPKTKKQWHTPNNRIPNFPKADIIAPGDAGIWATCDMGKEGRCVRELNDLFQEHAEKLYPGELQRKSPNPDGAQIDVAAEINEEVQTMHEPTDQPRFVHVRLDVQCVMFFKTRTPIEPVSFVHAICKDAVSSGVKHSRFVKRLTPMTVMGKATENGLDEVAKLVLKPHFQDANGNVKKFAIRPSLRNHGKGLTRDSIIKQVAALVSELSPQAKVDLNNYDLLILVEVYKSICGMSVVGSDYDELKRYNLAEIFSPTPRTTVDKTVLKKDFQRIPS